MRHLPWLLLVTLLCATAAVFWCFPALPFMDLPAHAGLTAVRHRYASSPLDQSYFLYAPRLGPYSLFRTLANCACSFIGPLGAMRLLATLPAIATPLVIYFSRRTLHGDRDPAMAALSVTFSFGLMTAFGFASYLLGITFLLLGVTLWLRLLAAPSYRRALALSVLSILVFVAHGHAFLLLLTICVATLLTSPEITKSLRWMTLFAPALGLAAYVTVRAHHEPGLDSVVTCGAAAVHFQGPLDKLSLLVTPTLMTRLGVDILVGIGIWVLLSAGLFRSFQCAPGALERLTTQRLTLAIATLGLAFLVLPHTLSWFGFVDGRLVLPILLLAVIAIQPGAFANGWVRVFRWGAYVLPGLQIAVVCVASSRFQKEAAGFDAIRRAIPTGATLLHLPLRADSPVFAGHPFVHYDKLALVDRPMLPSDIWYHAGSALYPRTANPARQLPATYCESDLKHIDWSSLPLQHWDHVLVRVNPGEAPPPVPQDFALLAHAAGWWLWRNDQARRPLPAVALQGP